MPRCPVCQEIVWGEKVHRECLKKLEYVEEPLCKKCGKPIFAEEVEYCFDCTKHEKALPRGGRSEFTMRWWTRPFLNINTKASGNTRHFLWMKC